ncbi:MAG: OmpA family protein, partial [Thiopseudomonas sp.]|nr:OmpA family protein [Thiopseudomonas sp.]
DVHARDLQGNGARVVLEGHADERGTREYNMALGERRAQAVQRYLVLQGVSPAQLEPVSYGEERPVVIGHDDSAWSQNRRVELRK